MIASIRDSAPAARALMEAVLRGGESLAAEYPLVFAERAPGRIVVLEDEEAPRSACAILPRTLITPRAKFTAGLIGSVVTHEDHRGRGLASSVLDHAENELRSLGCLFAMLWADDPAFYEKRGYQPIGCEVDVVLPSSLATKLPAAESVRLAEPRDAAAIHGLYERHPERVERSASETRLLLASPGMETLVHENAGQVTAYACLGRGADLAGVVHEWAGKTEEVGALLHAILRRRALRGERGDLVLMAPRSAEALLRQLGKLGARTQSGVLGMAKLLDLERLRELVAWFLGPDGDVRVDTRPSQRPGGEPGLRIQGPNMALLFDAQQIFRIMFCPRAERDEVRYLERALGVSLDALPLAPFVWGLDSI